MIFASKPPSENNDPFPYAVGRVRLAYPGTLGGERSESDPRPEFDHVQHNEPNYLLVEAREFNADPKAWVSAMSDPGFIAETAEAYGVEISREHYKHAHRVLTRLAKLIDAGA